LAVEFLTLITPATLRRGFVKDLLNRYKEGVSVYAVELERIFTLAYTKISGKAFSIIFICKIFC
jgi:hypothetical protein